MAELVAIDLPAALAVDALRAVWDGGDTALLVDRRLPPVARRRLLEALRPAAIVDEMTGPSNRRRIDVESPPTADGDALAVPTSGTTGDPKGVILTHDAVHAHARAVHQRLSVDPAIDRWLACLPLAHIGGLGVVTRALTTGTPLTVFDQFDADRVEAAASTPHPCTLVSLVPTALDRIDAARYRWVVLGGSGDLADRPPNVVHTYGLTESGGGVVYAGQAIDGVQIRISDDEVQLRGPTLLRAYRDGTDPRTADGWLPTGDLGALDVTGMLSVHGRHRDLIITGGENVWPGPVEAVLRAHPDVAEVAVVGRTDEEWGQQVVAFVVPRAALDPPTLAELRDHVKQSLPAFAAPRHLVLVDALPKTALGKVRRSDLA